MIDLLCLLLPYALRFINQPWRNWYLLPATVAAYLIDRLLARTSFAWMVGRGPQGDERTISDMLETLCVDSTHPDRLLFVQIGLKINRVAGYSHIKACVTIGR